MKTINIKKISKKRSVADKLLGRFKDVVPKGKKSSEYVRELRGSLYGKTSQK